MSAAILVVDDSSFNRLLLKRRLAELGHGEPEMAADGVQALAAIAARRFDVVLLDLEMPELDGIGVLERLHGRADAPPVIVISAQTDMAGVIRCIELGAEDYLPKSFDPPLLRARLQAVVDKKALRDLADQRRAALEAEMETARRAQLSIVPRGFAALARPGFALHAHMEPAREVGGDLYDLLPLPGGQVLFGVADVTGKGAPAGLTMARCFGLVRAAARMAPGVPDPAALLALANDDLAAENEEMTFVTALFGVLDPATGAGRLCNAGHEAPLRLRAGGAAELACGPIQPALGVVEGYPYASHPFAIPPGEGLLLLTDGVTEAQDPGGDLLGKEAVLAALGGTTAPEEAVAKLLMAIAAHARGAPAADDVTMLALSRPGA
ncbi:PP2C family protein-serine/threonine phosphatase [Roseococcus sp. DSY-14]|uniref:PP2C family protein-serine/threonine phosphatase n=1 Tax=Roseococcus sp. DSY-14 TaxID=3369650 RepID=UPI00387B403B